MAQLWHDYVLILDIAQRFREAGKSLILIKPTGEKKGRRYYLK